MRNIKWGSRALMVALTTGLLGFSAHADDKQTKEQVKQDKEVGKSTAQRKKFAGKVALFNAKEIALAKLAEEQGSDQRVKDFARQLQEDHQKSQDNLKSWADSQQIEIASVDLSGQPQGVGGSGAQQGYQEEMKDVGEKLGKGIDEARKDLNELKAKQGKDFDKAFLSRIANDQREGRKLLSDGRKEHKSDPGLLNLLNNAVTVVSAHETTAKQLEKEIK